MNMQMRLFSRGTAGCKNLSYHIRNDITTCNMRDVVMKSANFNFRSFYELPSCFKDFITIHEYANNIICIPYHMLSGVCLSFNLVPSLEV